MSETAISIGQAAEYACKLNLDGVTLALFVPVDDETVLAKLSGGKRIGSVLVTVVAIGWTCTYSLEESCTTISSSG